MKINDHSPPELPASPATCFRPSGLTTLIVISGLLFAGCSRDAEVTTSTPSPGTDTEMAAETAPAATSSAPADPASTTVAAPASTGQSTLAPAGQTAPSGQSSAVEEEHREPDGQLKEPASPVSEEEKSGVQERTVESDGVLSRKEVEAREGNQSDELREEDIAVERFYPEGARQRGSP